MADVDQAREELPALVLALLAEVEIARAARLEWRSIRNVVDPIRHHPDRTAKFMASLGWRLHREGRGGSLWRREDLTVFLPERTDYVDWDKRMSELVRDLADVHETGELGVLAGIEAAGD
jgi:hypothetical protein